MATEQASLREVFHGRRGGFLAALLLAEFGGGMQGLAYSTVLPVIARDLDGFALFGATLAAGNIAAVLMLSVTGPVLAWVRPNVVVLVATAVNLAGAALAVFAPTMGWVLAGTVVRGVAAGLLAGFGTSALGGLYDERERPRVFGLFAFVWLIPSVAGPALNAAVAQWAGWRWAIAWPALLVLAARILMGAYTSAIPWERRREPVRAGAGVAVGVFLALGAWASALSGAIGIGLFAVAVVGGAASAIAFVVRGAHSRRLAAILVAFGTLCAAFFGGYELLSVTVIEGFGGTLAGASVAVTAALLCWTLAGMRPRPKARPDRVIVGPVLILAALAGLVGGVVWASGIVGIGLAVACAALAGLGMGTAYPVVSAEPFSGPEPATTVGTLVSFMETAGAAWAALLAGGLYSALHGVGVAASSALSASFAILVPVAAAAVVAAVVRRRAAVS